MQFAQRQGDTSGLFILGGLLLLAFANRKPAGDSQPATLQGSVADIAVSQDLCLHIAGARLPKNPGQSMFIRTFYIPNVRDAAGSPLAWPFRVRSMMGSNIRVAARTAAQPLEMGSVVNVIDPVIITSAVVTWAASSMGATVESLAISVAPPHDPALDMVLDIGCAVQHMRVGGNPSDTQEANWVYARNAVGDWAAAVLNDAIEVSSLTLQAGIPSNILVSQQRAGPPTGWAGTWR